MYKKIKKMANNTRCDGGVLICINFSHSSTSRPTVTLQVKLVSEIETAKVLLTEGVLVSARIAQHVAGIF